MTMMTDIVLTKVIASYPKPFDKTESYPGGALKYRCAALIDKSTDEGKKLIKKLYAEADKVCQEKFKKPFKNIKWPENRCGLIDGDEAEDDEGNPKHPGFVMIRANSDKPPQVVDRDGRSPIYKEDDKIYGGAIINMCVNPYAMDGAKRGFYFGLGPIQYVAKGVRLGAEPTKAEDVFGDVSDEFDDAEEDDDI